MAVALTTVVVAAADVEWWCTRPDAAGGQIERQAVRSNGRRSCEAATSDWGASSGRGNGEEEKTESQ
jgi:hypothetical protein